MYLRGALIGQPRHPVRQHQEGVGLLGEPGDRPGRAVRQREHQRQLPLGHQRSHQDPGRRWRPGRQRRRLLHHQDGIDRRPAGGDDVRKTGRLQGLEGREVGLGRPWSRRRRPVALQQPADGRHEVRLLGGEFDLHRQPFGSPS